MNNFIKFVAVFAFAAGPAFFRAAFSLLRHSKGMSMSAAQIALWTNASCRSHAESCRIHARGFPWEPNLLAFGNEVTGGPGRLYARASPWVKLCAPGPGPGKGSVHACGPGRAAGEHVAFRLRLGGWHLASFRHGWDGSGCARKGSNQTPSGAKKVSGLSGSAGCRSRLSFFESL